MYGEMPVSNKKKHIPNSNTESGSLNFEGGELDHSCFLSEPPVFFNLSVTNESKLKMTHINIRKN